MDRHKIKKKKKWYKCIMANSSAIRQQAAHTTYQISSPRCSTRAIQKSLTLNEIYSSFLEKSQENGPLAEKWQDRKSKRTRRKKQEIGKGSHMTALRFQTGGWHQTSPVSLQERKRGKSWEREKREGVRGRKMERRCERGRKMKKVWKREKNEGEKVWKREKNEGGKVWEGQKWREGVREGEKWRREGVKEGEKMKERRCERERKMKDRRCERGRKMKRHFLASKHTGLHTLHKYNTAIGQTGLTLPYFGPGSTGSPWQWYNVQLSVPEPSFWNAVRITDTDITVSSTLLLLSNCILMLNTNADALIPGRKFSCSSLTTQLLGLKN